MKCKSTTTTTAPAAEARLRPPADPDLCPTCGHPLCTWTDDDDGEELTFCPSCPLNITL